MECFLQYPLDESEIIDLPEIVLAHRYLHVSSPVYTNMIQSFLRATFLTPFTFNIMEGVVMERMVVWAIDVNLGARRFRHLNVADMCYRLRCNMEIECLAISAPKQMATDVELLLDFVQSGADREVDMYQRHYITSKSYEMQLVDNELRKGQSCIMNRPVVIDASNEQSNNRCTVLFDIIT